LVPPSLTASILWFLICMGCKLRNATSAVCLKYVPSTLTSHHVPRGGFYMEYIRFRG
jgi:hypothetical protein